ncbi:MAG: DUF2189 domain-containing protein [Pikeienuella sp.]
MPTDINPPSPAPIINHIRIADVLASLKEGLGDYLRAPAFGLFFSAFYVLGGLTIWAQVTVISQSWWIIPLGLGFPLFAPFAAVGLYEVSRRLEASQPLDWGGVLGVVVAQSQRQVPALAAIIIMIFMFWAYAAHLVFALFFGLSAMTNVTTSYEILFTTNGMVMLAVGTAVGAGLSAVLFSISVVGLPLMLDREIDFVSAMIASVRSVFMNPVPMLFFAFSIGLIMLVGLLPIFLGLFVALPVLGHATWRLYRRVVTFEDA